MKIVRGISDPFIRNELSDRKRRSVLTVGNFDGVHLGHQALVRRVVEKKLELQTTEKVPVDAVLMTFDPHPRQIIQPEAKFTRLFSLRDQEERMRVLGVDVFILQPFSRDLADTSPDAFLAQLILRPLNPAVIIVGYDFSFGRHRAGTIEFLQAWGRQMGVPVEILSPVRVENEIVSSTRIRQALQEGDLLLTNKMLNRFFQLEGWIERGAGRGKNIGIPTANIHSVDEIVPRSGVYVTDSWVNQKWQRSITNVGFNPTFESGLPAPRVETHILDYAGDLYGEKLQVRFLDRVRDERKFSGAGELVKQIHLDIESARSWVPR